MSRRSVRLGRKFDEHVARLQYHELLDAFREAGVETHFLEPDPSLPYMIYARDSSVMTPWGAIITQLESPWRRGEWRPVLEFYERASIPIYDIVTAGSFEGGDFMVLSPGVILCGVSGGRTSSEGLEQVRSWIESEGWTFRSYRFDPFFLHLDTMFAMVAEKLAVMCVDAVEDELVVWIRDQGIEIIDLPFKAFVELGVNVVALGDDRVLVPHGNSDLKDRCRAHGLTVFDPDVSMFTAGGGGVHCMCQPLRRDSV